MRLCRRSCSGLQAWIGNGWREARNYQTFKTALGFVVTLERAGAESRQLKDRATRFRAVEELLRDGTQRIWISGKLSSNQATS